MFLLAVGCTVGDMHVSSVIAKPRTTPECYCFVSPVHTDELCDSMMIGRLYRVIGFPAHVQHQHSISWSVEANSVQPWVPECKAVNDLISTLLQIYTNCSHKRTNKMYKH